MNRSGCTWNQVMQYAREREEAARQNNRLRAGTNLREINMIELLVADLKRIYQIR